MTSFMKFKVVVIIIGSLGLIFRLLLFYFDSYFAVGGPCHMNYLGNCNLISTLISNTAALQWPLILLFIFSLITYFMRDSVFRAWAWFAIPATLVSMLLIYITPEYSGGGFGPQISVGKGDVALLTSAVFVVVSIVVIVTSYVVRKKP